MPKMTSSEAMVETLRIEGVDVVPGVVGSAFMDALDLFPAAGIRFLPVRHEQAAGHMADAYARVTGRPAVCIGQNGPGITNMVTSIAAAYHAHSPVIVVTPSASTGSRGLSGFQEIDQLSIFRSVTQFQVQLSRPDRMAETFRTAFREALTRCGPVQVDIPRDYFYGETDEDMLEPYQYRPTGPLAVGDTAALDHAADLLSRAERPLIVAGYGVVVADAQTATAELAELLTAPVANSYLHNDSFPMSHDLAVGPIGYMGSKAAMELMSEADVVLFLGSRNNVFGTLPQYGMDFYPDQAAVVQVDVDPSQLGRSKPIELGIVGDARKTAEALAQRLRTYGWSSEPKLDRLEWLNTRLHSWQAELRRASLSEEQPISPRRALDEVSALLDEDTIVTTDIGNVSSTANSYLRFEKPRRFIAAMTFGNCGFAYPAALGAQLANPRSSVVSIVGDGAWGMSLNETMTAVEEGLPVTAIVFNNQQWGAEKRNQIDFYDDRYVGTNIGHTVGGFDFARIAQSMGAEGFRVIDPSCLKDALSSALTSETPSVVEIMIDPSELAEPFRRDALRKPVRYLDRYAHLNSKQ